jgi:hypothetical protein
MKHQKYIYETDELEIASADKLISEGKAIRKKVLTRVRNRAWREKQRSAKQ